MGKFERQLENISSYGYIAGSQGQLQKKKKCDVLSLANNGKRGRQSCMRTLWEVINCRD